MNTDESQNNTKQKKFDTADWPQVILFYLHKI